MAIGPNTDPIPYQGYTKALFVNLKTLQDVTKASAGSPVAIGQITVENNSGATAYVQIFDAAAANVALGTTRPDIEIPVTNAAEVTIQFPTSGGAFPSGCALTSTTATEGSVASSNGVRATIFYR